MQAILHIKLNVLINPSHPRRSPTLGPPSSSDGAGQPSAASPPPLVVVAMPSHCSAGVPRTQLSGTTQFSGLQRDVFRARRVFRVPTRGERDEGPSGRPEFGSAQRRVGLLNPLPQHRASVLRAISRSQRGGEKDSLRSKNSPFALYKDLAIHRIKNHGYNRFRFISWGGIHPTGV